MGQGSTVGWPDDSSSYASQLDAYNQTASPHFVGQTFEIDNGDAYDLGFAFVPALDDEWLNEHFRLDTADDSSKHYPVDGTVPMIDSREPNKPDLQRGVGLVHGGDSSNDRKWAKVRYNENSSDRQFEPDIVNWDGGDSGGPTIASDKKSLPWSSESFEYRRRVVGSHKGNYQGDAHDSPLGYEVLNSSGNVMSLDAKEKRSARINLQWVQAVAADADLDGLPRLCDSDPEYNYFDDNLCTTTLGGGDPKEPRGLLKCIPGYKATGVKGNDGWYIDRISVRCTPTACLRNPTDSCPDEYWTEHFAGEGGGGTSYSETCSAGNVISEVRAQHDSGNMMYEFQVRCHDYDELVDNSNWTNAETLGIIGNSNGSLDKGTGTGWESCPGDEAFRGIEARSDLTGDDILSYVTGMQPICSSDNVSESDFVGAPGGWVNGRNACPRGMIGVGFVSAPGQNDSDDLGLLGLLCMDKDDVANDKPVSNSDLLVAHGEYYNQGIIYPNITEDMDSFMGRHGLGSDISVDKCDAGERVVSAAFEYDRSGDGELTQLDKFECLEDGSSNWIYPETGTESYYTTVSCNDDSSEGAFGFVMADGWNTDGTSVLCRPKN